jgi:hypothetical protein
MRHHMLITAALAMLLAGCTLTGESPPVSPTPALPQVAFLFPDNNAQVFQGTDLTLDILATDPTGGIARVDLFVDTPADGDPYQQASPVAAEAVPTFRTEMNWLAAGPGRHQFVAKAYRTDGTPSDEALLVIEVIPRQTPTP